MRAARSTGTLRRASAPVFGPAPYTQPCPPACAPCSWITPPFRLLRMMERLVWACAMPSLLSMWGWPSECRKLFSCRSASPMARHVARTPPDLLHTRYVLTTIDFDVSHFSHFTTDSEGY